MNESIEAEPVSVMTPSSTAEHPFRQYQAPQENGKAFIEPPLQAVPATIDSNQQLASQWSFPSAALRQQARRQLIEDAIRYTSSYREVDWLTAEARAAESPIIMAGHQPTLFHPGVWFKNFALSHLAQRTGAVAVNLVIDNDVGSGSSIRVPSIDESASRIRRQAVSYDEAGGGVPYEQSVIRDRESFDSFDVRVREAVASTVSEPCVTQMWNHARRAIERCGVAGCALAQARHGLEGEIGLQTLELPMAVVCKTDAFAEFILSILTELPRFHRCYNDAVQYYRREHGIRSSAHPVPELSQDDHWFEAPLWLYGDDDPQRRAVWVQLRDDVLIISDRHHRERQVDIRFPKLAARQLASFAASDFKLRPRALVTTMYARLVLSDLFLHGIGGGKYDQLGDQIIRSFLMITPPEFMVLSATVQLPDTELVSEDERVRELRRQIRDTWYQGERFASRVALDPSLLQQKRRLLANQPEAGHRKAWHDQITEINQRLAAALTPLREELQNELAETEHREASRVLMASREYAFCLFPLPYLTKTFQRILQAY